MSRNISRRLRRGAGAKCADATPKLKPCFRHNVSDRDGADGDGAGTAPLETQEPAMDRRHLLAGLAGLPFATAAFAQTAQPQSPAAQTGGAAGGVYGTAGVTNANSGAPGLGQAEQQWLQQTMMVGSVALQTSEIALQKAQDEDVKQFAKFEADEQKGLAEVLRSMLEPAGTASPQGAAGAAPQPDQKHAAMIQKLQQEQAGDAFDKDYVKGQLEGHRELLQIQERFIQARSQNREAMNVAKLAAGHIREHIQVLEDLQG
jgi:putative membrane protein